MDARGALGSRPPPPPPARLAAIEIVEPRHEHCQSALPPEGNVKLRNYRLLSENLRAYTPTGDIHTSPSKGKVVPRFEVWSVLSPPRARILELVRADDEGRAELEAIVRPAPRGAPRAHPRAHPRALARPLDDDARRFLQRTLLSPSPQLSAGNTPEPRHDTPHTERTDSPNSDTQVNEQEQDLNHHELQRERSLADELREAEEEERSGRSVRRDFLREWRLGADATAGAETAERERLGRLALAVEEDEPGAGVAGAGETLAAAARRLDALLAESRDLRGELAAIHDDIQAAWVRAGRCAAAARALRAEARALRYLDDVVALLRGEVGAARRAAAWPFALGQGGRDPTRSYVV